MSVATVVNCKLCPKPKLEEVYEHGSDADNKDDTDNSTFFLVPKIIIQSKLAHMNGGLAMMPGYKQ